jgi:hypothetical protein
MPQRMTSRIECSPATPWGIHPAVLDNACPRCGWIAREPQAVTGNLRRLVRRLLRPVHKWSQGPANRG